MINEGLDLTDLDVNENNFSPLLKMFWLDCDDDSPIECNIYDFDRSTGNAAIDKNLKENTNTYDSELKEKANLEKPEPPPPIKPNLVNYNLTLEKQPGSESTFECCCVPIDAKTDEEDVCQEENVLCKKHNLPKKLCSEIYYKLTIQSGNNLSLEIQLLAQKED